jgi:general stress protein 26
MSQTKILIDYLKEHRFMVLATATNDGKPESATIGYVVYDDRLLFNTYTHYRKYPNLISNPRVSCVVTSSDNNATLQLDGLVSLLKDEELAKAKDFMTKDWPEETKYFADERTRFFTIKPTWMRLRDYRTNPATIIEEEK